MPGQRLTESHFGICSNEEYLRRAHVSRNRKETMRATDVTGFYAFFSARKSGNFLHILGHFLPLHSKPGEKGKKLSLEKIQKNPVETFQMNLSLVVVELVLSFNYSQWGLGWKVFCQECLERSAYQIRMACELCSPNPNLIPPTFELKYLSWLSLFLLVSDSLSSHGFASGCLLDLVFFVVSLISTVFLYMLSISQSVWLSLCLFLSLSLSVRHLSIKLAGGLAS